jgi:hypothetical protein
MLLSRVYVMTFEVCQQCFVLSCVDVMRFEVYQNIHQTSLHKHGTKTQITPEIPQASLYKHGTAQITSDIP